MQFKHLTFETYMVRSTVRQSKGGTISSICVKNEAAFTNNIHGVLT